MPYTGPVMLDDSGKYLIRAPEPAKPRTPPRPAGAATHVHIHGAPARDARPRSRDQGEPSLLCRLAQNGESGEWAAEDGDGNPLLVRTAGDGSLEIHNPGTDNGNGPNPLGLTIPPGTRGQFAGGEDARRRRAGDAFLTRLDQRVDADGVEGLRSLQSVLNDHYARS